MPVIHKQQIKVSNVESYVRKVITLPHRYRILSIGLQEEVPVLWYENLDYPIDTLPYSRVTLCFFYTGREVCCFPQNFLGTLQYKDGIVQHVYFTV